MKLYEITEPTCIDRLKLDGAADPGLSPGEVATTDLIKNKPCTTENPKTKPQLVL